MTDKQENPFQITSPEGLTAEETVSLFVDVFTDFPKIKDQGHAFLLGPRGIGKSMMFRYLQADCQCLVEKCDFSHIPFLGMYVPIKNESFVKTEFRRFELHANEIFNENLMVLHIGIKVFDSILKNKSALNCLNSDSLFSYYQDIFLPLIYFNDTNRNKEDKKYSTASILRDIIKEMMFFYRAVSNFSKSLSFSTDLPSYTGPLFDYQDFLFPLLSELVNVKGFPKGTIYLLIDDAHILSLTQTRVLNSWIATRTSRVVSIKVSSEYSYKSYYTVTGATIDSPHDYYEIDMSTVYTTNNRGKSNYKDRIKSIVNRRLKLFSIDVSVEDFFPWDTEQEKEIKEIAEKYKKMHDDGKGRGYYRSDDAGRYARPDFIKSLAGPRKSSSTYSYAGFEQLVHLSSGIVRYFLEPAHQMYSDEVASSNNKQILFISPGVQDRIARKAASDALLYEMDKYKKGGDINAFPGEDIDRLLNLIHGLGGLFRQILLSNRSERRVFSIAISDNLSVPVEKILNIGINFGLFHRSTIGRKNKKSGGRTKLFVLNRRLAPNWTLDPTSFAGYLFVQNSILEEVIENPQKILSRIEKSGELEKMEIAQLNLFDEDEIDNPFEVYGEDDE
jgi:hypothetical protein